MLTSLCLSASIHSQMRLTTHTNTQKHTHLPLPSSPTVMVTVCYGKELPAVVVLLYTLLTLCSLLCFLLYLFPPLICSISLCHDESGRSSDRHRCDSPTARELCQPPPLSPLPSLPLCSLLFFSLSNSCLEPFSTNARSWPKRDVGQGQVRTNLCVFA